MNSTTPYPTLEMFLEEQAILLKSDFASFSARCFAELNPAVDYLPNWHHDLVATKLQACLEGRSRRLILNMPPRNMKSILASVALPAFWLGHRPSDRVICVSYGQALANRHAADCRTVMGSPWYQEIFDTAVEEFETTAFGSRLATSVGGALTGRGAEVIILDDPLKPDEALSEAQRETVNEWYDHTLLSRLNDKTTGVIILVMQRLHLDDLVGHVLEQGEWEVVSLPAIAEEPETHTFTTFLGTQIVHRQPGEVLHPEREPRRILDELRAHMGEYAFSAQYQQAPVPYGGGAIKEDWLRYYDQLPAGQGQVFQSWDTANKDTELNDYSVCTTWRLRENHLYLVDVFRKRMNYPELKRAVLDQAQRHKPTTVLIEDRSSGTPLIQELRQEGKLRIHLCTPKNSKVMRLHFQTPWFENGRVHLPREASWLADYRRELLAFPKIKHDDQVDSTTQALEWAGQPVQEWRIYSKGDRISNSAELDDFVHGGRTFRLW